MTECDWRSKMRSKKCAEIERWKSTTSLIKNKTYVKNYPAVTLPKKINRKPL